MRGPERPGAYERSAVETSSQHEVSSLSAYLRVLRRRKWIVLACVILAPLTAYVVSARQTALYQASAQVYLSSQDLAGALTGISAPYVDEQRLADTQSALAQVPAVASRAIKISGLKGISPEGLLGSTSVVPGGNTNILTFTVTSTNPRQAELLATAYAKAFTSYRGQLDSDAVRRARVEISKQLDRLTASGLDNGKLAVSLRDKDQQLATLQALQTSRTYVIREADGAAQIAPTPRKNALIGLMLGLVLGLGLAFGIEALDTRVRTSSEVGDRLGLPLLARIPPPPKGLSKDDRLVMLAQPTGTNAETFRMLRTNLDFAMLEHEGPRTILVTSAIEGEGKSTTAANLAVAEARAGRRVALVDLDLRVPYLDRFFGLTHAQGITDVALGNIELGTALRRIDLGTGAPLPPATEYTSAHERARDRRGRPRRAGVRPAPSGSGRVRQQQASGRDPSQAERVVRPRHHRHPSHPAGRRRNGTLGTCERDPRHHQADGRPQAQPWRSCVACCRRPRHGPSATWLPDLAPARTRDTDTDTTTAATASRSRSRPRSRPPQPSRGAVAPPPATVPSAGIPSSEANGT